MIPLPLIAVAKSPITRYVAVALGVVLLLFVVYSKGEAHVQALWDADKARIEAEIEKAKNAQVQVTTVVETKYVDRIKYVKGKSTTIVNTVDRLIPVYQKCDIPENAVNLLDAAARNISVEEVK
jgi:hypothetical protein